MSAGCDAAPAGLHAYQATPVSVQQWAHSSLNWCAEPYAACQPAAFVPVVLQPVQQFVARPVAPPGPPPRQWGRQHSGELPPDSLGSLAWQQVHVRAYQPYVQGGGGGGHTNGGRYSAPPRSHGGYGPGSAPASAMCSPVLDRSQQRGAPGSTPPPPPLTLPVLELQVGAGGAAGRGAGRGAGSAVTRRAQQHVAAACFPPGKLASIRPPLPVFLATLLPCSTRATPARTRPTWSASWRRPRPRWRRRPAACRTSPWCVRRRRRRSGALCFAALACSTGGNWCPGALLLAG